jgi:uncharacterized protein YjeT (DUF2065 family)
MKSLVLGALVFIWLADGFALLIAPRGVVEHVREMIAKDPSIFRWGIFGVAAGTALSILSFDLFLHPIWIDVGIIMILKGCGLWLAPDRIRGPVVAWCLSREDVDYRFVGLALCGLAVLLLRALGWIGAS